MRVIYRDTICKYQIIILDYFKMERDGNLDFESAMGYFSNMFPTLTKQTIKDILESLKSQNLRELTRFS